MVPLYSYKPLPQYDFIFVTIYSIIFNRHYVNKCLFDINTYDVCTYYILLRNVIDFMIETTGTLIRFV